MLRFNRHLHWSRSHPWVVTRRTLLVDTVLVALLVLLFAVVWASAARGAGPVARLLRIPDRLNLELPLSPAVNATADVQTLISNLKQDEPAARRTDAMTALKDAPPAATPILLAALADPDPGVRSGAAKVFGLRRESRVVIPLLDLTHDPVARVREAATWSLGEIGSLQAVPRLEQLQVVEANAGVQEAARISESQMRTNVAKAIGVKPSEVLGLAVAASSGEAYAVTASDLYVLHDSAWERVSALPDVPTGISTAPDGRLIYLATASTGLYNSRDGGQKWQHVQFGMQTPTQLTTTAVAIDPNDVSRIYLALAASGLDPNKKSPLGIFASVDGGATWSLLPGSPAHALTTRLILDPAWLGYLFGVADETPWRYTLPYGLM